MDRNVLLEMRGITKKFGESNVLNGVDFALLSGEVHALLGENGAGKSTLMKILSGVYSLDAGEVRVNDVPRKRFSPAEAMQEGISIVYQDLSLVPELTVADNLFLGIEPRSWGMLRKERIHRAAQGMITEYGFPLKPQMKVGDLSYAQQQMVEILKALSKKAQILVLDEPTASLTVEEEETLFSIINDLRAHGKGIIYISHRMDEVLRVADRITVLRDGINQGTIEKDRATLDLLIQLITGTETTSGSRIAKHHRSTSGIPALEVRELSTSGKLRQATFTIYEGEILGVAGLVGSGRTTLARALFGLERIIGGHIRFKGESYKPQSPAQAIDAGVALIPEQRREQGLFGELSIENNITMTVLDRFSYLGNLKGLAFVNKRNMLRYSEEKVADLKIACRNVFQKAGELSGGTQQKVILSRWLSKDPKLLIMDDPTAGVDITTKQEIWTIMDNIAQKGTSILFISSDLKELVQVSHRIVVMADGAIIREIDTQIDEISVRRAMQHAMVQ